MWYFLYNIVLLVSAPAIILILFLKKRCRRGLRQRIGFTLPEGCAPDETILWMHAVSMGEVFASIPLVHAIHQAYPHLTIIVSTVTDTGREVVEHRLAGIARHCYLPLDWPWTVRRFIRHLRPSVFLVVETELWPNLLKELQAYRVSTVLVNGRLSTRSFQRYLWVPWFAKEILSFLTLCLMQSDRDVQRLIALGAQAERVHRTGNMKCDIELAGLSSQTTRIGPHHLGLHDGEILIVAGSTHPREEDVLLSCYREILEMHPTVVFLMAPRHIERSDQLEETIRSYGFEVTRRSRLGEKGEHRSFPTTGPRVIVLDTRGELAHVYALARVTFVGGTFVPVGGHNLLEPASCGKPVLFGPFTDHCQEIADLLLEYGGGGQVRDGGELASLLLTILDNHPMADRMGNAARQVVLDHQGVVKRTIELVSQVIPSRA